MYILLHVLTMISGILAKLIILLMTSNMRPNGMFIPCKAEGKRNFTRFAYCYQYCAILGPKNNLLSQTPKRLPLNSASWFYWSLWLAFCIPEFLTLIRCFRIVCFKFVPNPSAFLLFFSLLVETVHTIGVCLLIFSVLPDLDTVRGAMLLSATAVLPSLLSALTRFWPTSGDGCKKRWLMCIFDSFAFVMQVEEPTVIFCVK